MADTLPRMKPDENALDGAFYPIVSLYYDSPDRACYWEKVEKYQNRRKMRVRVYGSLDGKLPPTMAQAACPGLTRRRRTS